MDTQSGFLPWLRRSGWAVLLIALAPFALHLWTNARDNFFRDELYYLAAGQHLDLGYVEYPPLVAVAAAFGRTLIGDSVLAIRLLPALTQVGIVLLTAGMVAMLGGGLAAQCLAGLAIALGPAYVGSSGILTMDAFDLLWWASAAWVLVRLIKREEPRWWPLFGAVVGVGLLTKLTIGFFVAALLLGLLLSPSRRLLFNRWLLIGGLIALGLAWPYIAWQMRHGFPVVEYTGIYSSGKTYQASPIEYLLQQIITTNPLLFPLALAGLYFLFFHAAGRPYRAFGWAYLFLYAFFMIQKAKWYWLTPAYPMLFASGAFALQLAVQRVPKIRWLQPSYAAAVALTGLLMVPLAIPILAPDNLIRLNAMLGGIANVKQENRQTAELPQGFADRYGWTEMVAAVQQAYDTLTPDEQAQTCVLARNYGEAAAVDFYGPALGLPRAISGHNSYYLWGPQGCTGKVIISINYAPQDLAGAFESIEAAGPWTCEYCMPDEKGAPIYIAKGLKAPILEAWPTVKDFN